MNVKKLNNPYETLDDKTRQITTKAAVQFGIAASRSQSSSHLLPNQEETSHKNSMM